MVLRVKGRSCKQLLLLIVLCLLFITVASYVVLVGSNKPQATREVKGHTLANYVTQRTTVLSLNTTHTHDKPSGVRAGCIESQASDGHGDLKFLRQNGYACDLGNVDLDALPDSAIPLTFHSYLDNIDVVCSRKIRAGKIGDGGWEVCDDMDVRPKSPCTVYSFGINNDFSFDDDVAKLYGCHVFSFDPSMGVKSHNRSDKVHFFNVGLWGETGQKHPRFPGWMMYTLKDLKSMLGHTKVDIVKIDIETSEWMALPNILDTGQLDDVQQLYMEFHAIWNLGRHTILPQLKIFQRLEGLGFRKFDVHKNVKTPRNIPRFPVGRTKCYEVHYLKRK
ncbi:probable methyltransferase-like protein 24 [Physella acuta]|uniref:probable methyltransferase-like protein 24 n=1 Tax=Physella acuta TaxID=109671 RepID=UPI0027DE101E|nr:probable methyltransferase-like protein 24 [Physella acuta]